MADGSLHLHGFCDGACLVSYLVACNTGRLLPYDGDFFAGNVFRTGENRRLQLDGMAVFAGIIFIRVLGCHCLFAGLAHGLMFGVAGNRVGILVTLRFALYYFYAFFYRKISQCSGCGIDGTSGFRAGGRGFLGNGTFYGLGAAAATAGKNSIA